MSFCILPFSTLYVENNRVRLCCESEERIEKYITPETSVDDIWNGEFFQDTRRQMLAGELPDACRICRLHESVGEESKRQWENSKVQDRDYYIGNDHPTKFDLRLSNKCNLECVMCNGIVSSAITKRVREYTTEKFVIQTQDDWNQQEHILKYVDGHKDSITELKFCGGEPFLQEQVLTTLESLVNAGVAGNIDLTFITNCTVQRERWFRDVITQFKSVKLNLSVDGVGDTLEYVRWPSRWDIVDKNVRLFKELSDTHRHIRVSLSPVIHLLNALELHRLFEYAAELKLNIALGPVLQTNNETYLHTNLLTDELRCTAWKNFQPVLSNPDLSFNIGRGFVQDLLKQTYTPDPRQVAHLNSVVKYWDSHRPVKFQDQFPHLDYLINN